MSTPVIVSLDGKWQFAYEPELDEEKQPDVPHQKCFTSNMPVPGYWDDSPEEWENPDVKSRIRRNPDHVPLDYSSIDVEKNVLLRSTLPYIIGVGYYRKTITCPSDWKGKTVTLRIGGVGQRAWAWVNRKPVGHHLGHSTQFEFPIEHAVEPGAENELIIAVTNAAPERGGFALSGFKGRSAGIYRSVSLKVAGATRIADCYIYPKDDLAQLNWHVELAGKEPKSLVMEWSIEDRNTAEVLGSGSQAVNDSTVTWATESFGMKPWSDRDPVQYVVRLTLKSETEELDELRQLFGLRRLQRNGRDLLLNGNPIFLRGVCDHCYFPKTCNPPADKGFYVEMIRQLKAVGFNWTRFHTWVPCKEYMQAADDLGMLVMVEAPVGFEEPEWIDMLRACRVHPSVVIYSGGNEECLDEERIEYLARMADNTRRIAPDALFNPQEGLRGVEYGWDPENLGNDIVEEPFRHNPSRLARLKEFSDVFGQYAWGALSYRSVDADRRMLDKRMEIYEAPLLSHEISIKGSYIDFDLEHRMEGTRIGTIIHENARKVLQAQDLYRNAPIYYRNSCAWQRIFRKHVIEMTRKCKYTRGYDFLGGHDHHDVFGGYHAGLMNAFFELKPGETVEDLLRYNNESVLLLDQSNDRNLKSGDVFDLPLLFSFYSQPDIETGTVSWHVMNDDSKVIRRGSMAIGAIRSGTLTELGNIKFVVPAIGKATKLRLFVRLSSAHHESTNDWDFWGFPEVDAGEGGNESLCVVSELNADTFSLLEAGGRVVLLGSAGFPTREIEHQVALAGRVTGNLATVINPHPITDGFPHDGWVNWQFNSMFTGACAVVFNDLDVPFDPIIEVVSSYKFPVKQSCLFEVAVNNGRLLVCTLRFDRSDPASSHLLACILRYAGNDQAFSPRTRIDVSVLRGELGRDVRPDPAGTRDTSADDNRAGNIVGRHSTG